MSLKSELNAALATISPFHSGRQTVSAASGDEQLTCALVALDKLACAFEHFSVSSPALQGASTDRLQKVSQALSARLTYLLEPVSPIETDIEGCVVQLRSSPPHKDDDGTTYYELLVRRDGVMSLCRYQKATGSSRQPVPAEVTRHVLGRLADDFAAVL